MFTDPPAGRDWRTDSAVFEPLHQQNSGDSADEPFTEAERNAMRAYLQRTEVRLSTLHRIAVTFISGAGLLLLFPTFFKEEITVLIRIFLDHSVDLFTAFGANQIVLVALLYLLMGFPFVLSLTIPIYALYLLLKDIVHFYFTIYTPGFATNVFTPSFALSGVTFSPDESPRVKKAVFEYQYKASSVNFAIPFSAEKREKYFDETIENTDGEIIPRSRRPDILAQYDITPDDAEHQRRIAHLNTAFGLARTTDRRLVEEVAMQEMSMTRHILYLRRLVMRYVKTLLMFVWTTISTFVMLPFLQDERLPTFMIFSLGYVVWSAGAMPIMHAPLSWIYRHKKGAWDKTHIDKQMLLLEQRVRNYVYAALVCSLVAFALSFIVYFT
ncbi:MAG: hypothetical protein SGI73_12635 [Chloroflexota bacterium]|nr:hypothetical protein [Chloroflexota bacterium]